MCHKETFAGGDRLRNWLITAREESKMTQEMVAQRAGILRPSYSNIENGERRPSVETAKKIAEVLGFEWTKFFEDEGEQY